MACCRRGAAWKPGASCKNTDDVETGPVHTKKSAPAEALRYESFEPASSSVHLQFLMCDVDDSSRVYNVSTGRRAQAGAQRGRCRDLALPRSLAAAPVCPQNASESQGWMFTIPSNSAAAASVRVARRAAREGDSPRSKYMADASDDTRPRKQRIRSSTGAAPSVGEVPSTSARHLPITSAEDTAASSSNVYFPPGYGIREAIPGTATAAAGGRESNAQPSCIKIGGVWCCCLLLLLLLALVFGDVGAHGDEWNPDPRCWRKGCL